MKHHEKLLYLGVALLALTGLCGCETRADSPISDGAPSAGSILAEAGRWILYLGLATIGAGILGKVLGAFPATAAYFKPFGAIADECIVLGIAAIGMGSCVVWIGVHSWIIYALSAIFVIVYLVRHRALLAGWLGFGPASPQTTPKDTP